MRILATLTLFAPLLAGVMGQATAQATDTTIVAAPSAPPAPPTPAAQAPVTAPSYPALFNQPTHTNGWKLNSTGYNQVAWKKQDVSVDLILTTASPNPSLLSAPMKIVKDIPKGIYQLNIGDGTLQNVPYATNGYVLQLVEAGKSTILAQSDSFTIQDGGGPTDNGLPTYSLHVGIGYGTDGVSSGAERGAGATLGAAIAALVVAMVV